MLFSRENGNLEIKKVNGRYRGSSNKETRFHSGSKYKSKQKELKQLKAHTLSSTLWLQRQHNDPYVAKACRLGYRSRAAFKLLEIDKKLHLLRPGNRVIDLGAAPGGWTQVAVAAVKASKITGGCVVAVDLNMWTPVPGAICLTCNFMIPDSTEQLKQVLGTKVDVVLSDMSPNITGHHSTDSSRLFALVEAAYAFALGILVPGGAFVAKIFQSSEWLALLSDVRSHFLFVHNVKPPSSRKDSAEIYLVAQGLRAQT